MAKTIHDVDQVELQQFLIELSLSINSGLKKCFDLDEEVGVIFGLSGESSPNRCVIGGLMPQEALETVIEGLNTTANQMAQEVESHRLDEVKH